MLQYKWLVTLTANVKLGLKCLTNTNTLAYYVLRCKSCIKETPSHYSLTTSDYLKGNSADINLIHLSFQIYIIHLSSKDKYTSLLCPCGKLKKIFCNLCLKFRPSLHQYFRKLRRKKFYDIQPMYCYDT